MNSLSVSIVIPTYNGATRINTLLNALKQQITPPFEVIVVIDGSRDNSRAVIESTKIPFRLTIIEQENGGRAVARNAGAKLAIGDLLIFYDDDMEPSATSIAQHLEFHEKYDGILSGYQFEKSGGDRTDIQNYKAHLSKKWTAKYYDGLNQLSLSNLFFTAANSSFKKNDFNSLKGFNELLTDAEDFDLALRALNSGIKVFFDKSNHAVHHDYITCTSYIIRQRQYIAANKKVSTFNHIKRRSVQVGLKRLFYSFFYFSWWPSLIDSNKSVLTFLPKKIRYKIYDWVIFSHSSLPELNQ